MKLKFLKLHASLIELYEKTGEEKYLKAAKDIADRIKKLERE